MENEAAVLYAAGDLRVEPYPMPEPGEREVLVQVGSVGVCGSDVHYYEHGRIGDFVVEAPLVLGHEACGVVRGVGERAERHAVGQRVAIEPGVPCGRCRECRAGRYNLCPDVRFLATPPVDGAFARYLAVHEDFVHPLPGHLSDAAGAMIEPLAVGVWANRKAGTTIGSRVLVTGAGPIGILAAQVARAAGAARVTVADVNPDRLRAARDCGADDVVDGRERLDPDRLAVDVLLECSGAVSAVQDGVSALRRGGVAVLVGMGEAAALPLPVSRIQTRELIVTGTFRYANVYPEAISLAASGRVLLDPLVGARLPLADTERALTLGRKDPSVLKALVVVNE